MNRPRASGGLNVLDLAAIGVAALIVVLEAGLWLWAGAAGVLFGSGWPRLTAGALPHTIVGVARHLSDPRQGFPARLRAGVPGPTGFYLALLLLAVFLGLAAAGMIKLRKRTRANGLGDSNHPGARWARAGDLDHLRSRRRGRQQTRPSSAAGRTSAGATGHGLSLGYRGRRLLRAEDRHALVVFGPTQSGKSAGIAIPNILEWAGPAVVVSIKPDLPDATLAARARRREGARVRPTRSVEAAQPHLVAARRRELLERSTPDCAADGLRRRDGHQHRQGRKLLVPGGRATPRPAPLRGRAHRSRDRRGRALGLRPRWRRARPDHARARRREPRPASAGRRPAGARCAPGLGQLAGETKGSIEGTAQVLLSAYRSPTVVRSADGTAITGQRLLEGQNTVYLISDSRRSKLLRPILIALLTELLDDAYETANRSPGRRLPIPLLVCLDELGNAVPLPNLAEIASTAASHNIQLISIFHDVAQARTRYRDQALTVINNHRARLLLSGVGDMETLRYFSELVGDEEVRDRSDPGAPIRRRPLGPADQLRQIKPEHGLLIYGSLRPATLRLRLYFTDGKLKHAA
jgi:type IV secretion system protein VirD4